MVLLVDTDAGITGIGQGGSPDTVRNVARSVIGRNAFETEMIWQAAFMDGFYSPGKERLHALGAIDLALRDIKARRSARRSTTVRRQGTRTHRVLRDVRSSAGCRAAGRSGGDEPCRARSTDNGGRVSRVPGGQQHPSESRRPRRRTSRTCAGCDLRFAIAHPADRRGGGADARRHRPRRQLDDRFASEVRFPRSGRSVPPPGTAPTVHRRGSFAGQRPPSNAAWHKTSADADAQVARPRPTRHQLSLVSSPSISRQILRGLSSRSSSGKSDDGKFWYATGRANRWIAAVPTDVERGSVVAG